MARAIIYLRWSGEIGYKYREEVFLFTKL